MNKKMGTILAIGIIFMSGGLAGFALGSEHAYKKIGKYIVLVRKAELPMFEFDLRNRHSDVSDIIDWFTSRDSGDDT